MPKLSESCECLCTECPTGSRICPTSHTCLDIEKWCDGLEDCPDDERDCTTSSVTSPTPTTIGIMTSKVPTVASIIEATTPPPKSKLSNLAKNRLYWKSRNKISVKTDFVGILKITRLRKSDVFGRYLC